MPEHIAFQFRLIFAVIRCLLMRALVAKAINFFNWFLKLGNGLGPESINLNFLNILKHIRRSSISLHTSIQAKIRNRLAPIYILGHHHGSIVYLMAHILLLHEIRLIILQESGQILAYFEALLHIDVCYASLESLVCHLGVVLVQVWLNVALFFYTLFHYHVIFKVLLQVVIKFEAFVL